jgi:hypothetical protein
MAQNKSITVLSTDNNFINQVHASTRTNKMALTVWTRGQMQRQSRAECPEAIIEMIFCNGIPAGSMMHRKNE